MSTTKRYVSVDGDSGIDLEVLRRADCEQGLVDLLGFSLDRSAEEPNGDAAHRTIWPSIVRHKDRAELEVRVNTIFEREQKGIEAVRSAVRSAAPDQLSETLLGTIISLPCALARISWRTKSLENHKDWLNMDTVLSKHSSLEEAETEAKKRKEKEWREAVGEGTGSEWFFSATNLQTSLLNRLIDHLVSTGQTEKIDTTDRDVVSKDRLLELYTDYRPGLQKVGYTDADIDSMLSNSTSKGVWDASRALERVLAALAEVAQVEAALVD